MFKEEDIVFEAGSHWVLKLNAAKGYKVFKTGLTHSTRVDTIGFEGERGLNMAIEKCKARATKELATSFSLTSSANL